MGQAESVPLDAQGEPSSLPQAMDRPGHPRVVALDLGKSRVGVAIADELGLLAHPRPPLDGHNKKALLRALADLAREEGVGLFLVGLPLDMSGAEGAMAARASTLAREITEATGVPVELFDERWTTREATQKLRQSGVDARRQKALVDGMAAAVMLQSFLDRARGGTTEDSAPLEMPMPPSPEPRLRRDRSTRRGRR
jgi:putative holliday junction resolvase